MGEKKRIIMMNEPPGEKDRIMREMKEDPGMNLESWMNHMKSAVKKSKKGKDADLKALAQYLLQRYVVFSVLLYKGYTAENTLQALVKIPCLPGSKEDLGKEGA